MSLLPFASAPGIKQSAADARYLQLTSILVATKDTILGTTPATKTIAYATDTNYFYFWNGSAWKESGVKMGARSNKDMGAQQDSSTQGYGDDYIADKDITHSRIGANNNTGEGQVRTSSGSFQWHNGTTWNDIVLGFRFREDSSGSYELEHSPIGFTGWYEVMSGNSDILDLDGNPIIQQYTANMGAYGSPIQLDGGSF